MSDVREDARTDSFGEETELRRDLGAGLGDDRDRRFHHRFRHLRGARHRGRLRGHVRLEPPGLDHLRLHGFLRRGDVRRTGRHHAAVGRAVRLPARSLRTAVGLSLRLDLAPGHTTRRPRGHLHRIRHLPGLLRHPVQSLPGLGHARRGDHRPGHPRLHQLPGRPVRRTGPEPVLLPQGGRVAPHGRPGLRDHARHE